MVRELKGLLRQYAELHGAKIPTPKRAEPLIKEDMAKILHPSLNGTPCGRTVATASRFVSALSQLNLSLSQLDLSFISAVSQHGNPAIPAAFRANSRLSHGYLTAISRLSPSYLPAIPSSAIRGWLLVLFCSTRAVVTNLALPI